MMTDLELQTVRDFILRAAAKFPRGITSLTLGTAVAAAGFELDPRGQDSLEAQLRYLVGRGLLADQPKAHTASLELYVLTPAGDDYLRRLKLPAA